MLLYIALFLITLIISIIAVWIYLSADHRRRFEQTMMDSTTQALLKTKGGVKSLTRESAKHKTLRSPKGGYKAPWGW